MSQLLETYSFTNDDIDLITFALRRLKDTASFAHTAKEAADLIEYIEREKKENTETVRQ